VPLAVQAQRAGKPPAYPTEQECRLRVLHFDAGSTDESQLGFHKLKR
jgi:hypothetical protein